MKRRLIGMAVLTALMLGCMTGCGESSEGSSVADSSAVVDATNTISEESSNTVSGNDDNGSKGEATGDSSYTGVNPDDLQKDENGNYPIDLMKLVPDAEVTHPDADFGTIMFQENELDMFNLPHSEFINITHASRSRNIKYTHNTPLFYFKSQAFGRGLNNPQLFLEYLTPENTLLNATTDHLEDDKYNDSNSLKAFAFIERMANDEYDYIQFYEGIQLRMPRTEIEAILGEGITGNDGEKEYAIYKSNNETMVILYVSTDEYIGEDVMIADEIYVIKND